MKKLVILGGSGIGMIAASIASDTKSYEVVGFLNDVVAVGQSIGKFTKFPVIGTSEDVRKFLAFPDYYFFVAYVGMQNEEKTYNKVKSLEIPQDRLADLIHPTAHVPKGFCSIGKGCLLAPLAQLSTDTFLSDNCIVLPNAFVGHDSFLDEFSHIATNGVIGSNVRIGKAVHIGSNATIREYVRIGDFSLVGAGSVVLNNVDSNSIVVGNPAKLLRKKEN